MARSVGRSLTLFGTVSFILHSQQYEQLISDSLTYHTAPHHVQDRYADPQGADDVHAAIPPRRADRRDARRVSGQTDAFCRRSAAVRYRVRSTRVLCCWTNSLQLVACQH